MLLFLACSVAYLVGSIQFGVILVKFFGEGDIRKIGSGNTGATNVMRTQSNKILGVLTFLLDMLKGYLPVFIFESLCGLSREFSVFVGASAIIGHMFPVFSGFRGGKGVSTSLGVFLSLTPLCAAVAAALWVLSFVAFKTSAVSSILAIICAAILSDSLDAKHEYITLVYASIAFVILLKHTENIKRILCKEELSFKCSKK